MKSKLIPLRLNELLRSAEHHSNTNFLLWQLSLMMDNVHCDESQSFERIQVTEHVMRETCS